MYSLSSQEHAVHMQSTQRPRGKYIQTLQILQAAMLGVNDVKIVVAEVTVLKTTEWTMLITQNYTRQTCVCEPQRHISALFQF